MKKQATNPYLPLWEHIPDGEPHVFDERLYVYGSHDRSHGTTFCMEDYVCWSADVKDLSDWRYEGVIYRKIDDPDNHAPVGYLYAPDVVKGPDGRYYLYYFYTGGNGRKPTIRVAVCDTPAGHYQFYGIVTIPEDGRFLCFDPAVLADDDGRIWLYYGSAFQSPLDAFRVCGGAVVELSQDMKTVIGTPKMTVPNITHARGTGFSGHAFFEASSIRKIRGKYYFIYSSMLSHELCYAVSDRPDGPFAYGGTIISNGDIGLNGNKKAVAPTGNNHGSLVEIGGQWYVFYHRHTQGTSFSRQGCAEPVIIASEGTIAQVEITSCGLNGKSLETAGCYPAAYCCALIPARGHHPCVDEEEADSKHISFVRSLQSGDTIGFKYFDFHGKTEVGIHWRCSLHNQGMLRAMNPATLTIHGCVELRRVPGGEIVGSIPVSAGAGDWEKSVVTISLSGKQALYLTWRGSGSLDIKEIEFQEENQ